MRHSLHKVFTASALTLALAACGQQSPDATAVANSEAPAATTEQPSAAQNETQRLNAFFARTFEEDLKRSPMSQSYLGYKWDYGQWDDVSVASEQEEVALLKQRLEELATFERAKLSEQAKLSYDIYKLNAERQLANEAFSDHQYVMHQFYGWHTSIPSFMINIHRVSSADDAQAYVSRLQGVNTLFDQVIEQLRVREKAGVYPPAWAYDQMIQAANNVVSGNPFEESADDSTIWADFNRKVESLEISNAEKSGLLSQAKDALLTSVKPAYEKLIAELDKQRQLTPEGDGVWRLPRGEAFYQNRLNWFTTTELTADQVHQIGLDNVQRIHAAMRDIMQQVAFEGELQDFFVFMRNDEQFYYPNTDEGRERYMREAKALIDTMEQKIPEYFGLTPKARMIVKRVEAFREKSAGKAFYQSPSRDGERPGIYYANLYDMQDMPTYQMEALAYHEGIPGHHMQRAIAQELEGIPDFQKYVSFTAYTEGWGLYTEELAKDMGFYEDPYSDFGRLAMELWRACRLVVDTGLHAKQWSREQAIQYLIDNTPNPEGDAVKAIERYIAMPGQATAYMIGKLKIMELRAWAQQELGDQFDIRGFHDEVLKDGPVPLNVLEDKIKAWAATLKQS